MLGAQGSRIVGAILIALLLGFCGCRQIERECTSTSTSRTAHGSTIPSSFAKGAERLRAYRDQLMQAGYREKSVATMATDTYSRTEILLEGNEDPLGRVELRIWWIDPKDGFDPEADFETNAADPRSGFGAPKAGPDFGLFDSTENPLASGDPAKADFGFMVKACVPDEESRRAFEALEKRLDAVIQGP